MSECVALPSSISLQQSEQKYCRVCGCELIIDVNWKESLKKSATYMCITHIRECHKKYYESNREKILECHKKYHENNREKRRECHKKYYESNREKILECQKKYRENNRETLREYQFKRYWLHEGREKQKVRFQTRRTRREELYYIHRGHRKLLRLFEGFFPLYTIRMVDI